MSDYISVHIVAATLNEAERLADALIEDRLAACVNILTGIQSVYRWKDKVERSAEVLLIAKTRSGLFDALSRRVREMHGHDCPCILALPILAGDADFLQWMDASTLEPAAQASNAD